MALPIITNSGEKLTLDKGLETSIKNAFMTAAADFRGMASGAEVSVGSSKVQAKSASIEPIVKNQIASGIEEALRENTDAVKRNTNESKKSTKQTDKSTKVDNTLARKIGALGAKRGPIDKLFSSVDSFKKSMEETKKSLKKALTPKGAGGQATGSGLGGLGMGLMGAQLGLRALLPLLTNPLTLGALGMGGLVYGIGQAVDYSTEEKDGQANAALTNIKEATTGITNFDENEVSRNLAAIRRKKEGLPEGGNSRKSRRESTTVDERSKQEAELLVADAKLRSLEAETGGTKREQQSRRNRANQLREQISTLETDLGTTASSLTAELETEAEAENAARMKSSADQIQANKKLGLQGMQTSTFAAEEQKRRDVSSFRKFEAKKKAYQQTQATPKADWHRSADVDVGLPLPEVISSAKPRYGAGINMKSAEMSEKSQPIVIAGTPSGGSTTNVTNVKNTKFISAPPDPKFSSPILPDATPYMYGRNFA